MPYRPLPISKKVLKKIFGPGWEKKDKLPLLGWFVQKTYPSAPPSPPWPDHEEDDYEDYFWAIG